MKELVRRSFLHQPLDGLGVGHSRQAAVDQWIKVRTHAPGTDDGNGVDELQIKLVLSPIRKDGMCVEREFGFQFLELLEELAALGTPQIGQVQNPNVLPFAIVHEPHHLILRCIGLRWDQRDGQFMNRFGMDAVVYLGQWPGSKERTVGESEYGHRESDRADLTNRRNPLL